jgi:hypothetical protein
MPAKYIIAHYFGVEKEDIDNVLGYYIKTDDDNGRFFEIRDPNSATKFNSIQLKRLANGLKRILPLVTIPKS